MQPKRTGVIPINVAIHTVSVCITRFQFAGRTRPIVAPLSIAKKIRNGAILVNFFDW
jgi:hypothetical protein